MAIVPYAGDRCGKQNPAYGLLWHAPFFHPGSDMKKVSNFSQRSREPKALVIIGAGHFGQRALAVLKTRYNGRIWLVDKDEESLRRVSDGEVHLVHQDAVEYLTANAYTLSPDDIIVPAVPFHLAYEFAIRILGKDRVVKRISVPPDIRPTLPYVWEGARGSLLISYADFKCPDDCPEPPYCTVTGQKRDKALYELFEEINLEGYSIYVIRSRQMGPGVGGYAMADLMNLCSVIKGTEPRKWLVGTACRCHGVLSGLELLKG